MNKENTFNLISEVKQFTQLKGDFITYQELTEFRKLGYYAKKHSKLCVAYCNGDIQQEPYDFKITMLQKRIHIILNRLNKLNKKPLLKVQFSFDPRGATVRVMNIAETSDDHFYYYLLGLH